MRYSVLESFSDRMLERSFRKGEEYPADEAPAEWVDSLASGNNRLNRKFIAADDTAAISAPEQAPPKKKKHP